MLRCYASFDVSRRELFIRKACQLSEPPWNPVWTRNSAPGRSRTTAQKISPRDSSLVPGQVQHLTLTNPNPPRPFSSLSCLRTSGVHIRAPGTGPAHTGPTFRTKTSRPQPRSPEASGIVRSQMGPSEQSSDPDGSVRAKFSPRQVRQGEVLTLF